MKIRTIITSVLSSRQGAFPLWLPTRFQTPFQESFTVNPDGGVSKGHDFTIQLELVSWNALLPTLPKALRKSIQKELTLSHTRLEQRVLQLTYQGSVHDFFASETSRAILDYELPAHRARIGFVAEHIPDYQGMRYSETTADFLTRLVCSSKITQKEREGAFQLVQELLPGVFTKSDLTRLVFQETTEPAVCLAHSVGAKLGFFETSVKCPRRRPRVTKPVLPVDVPKEFERYMAPVHSVSTNAR